MQILLMDEDPAVRVREAGALKARFEAVQCLEITSAAELESALERGDFAAVLTGDRLGWAAGRETLPLIKAHCPNVPVLMVTDVNDVPYAVEALRSGLSDYVLLRDLQRLPDALLTGIEQAQAHRQRPADLEQLRAGADHYRIAAELASDFAYTLHVPAPGQPPRLEWASGAFSRITGYSLVDVLSTGWTHFIDPQDLPLAEQHARRLAVGEPAETETMLYRIVQEALTNVTRHAQAGHVGILLERRDDRVTAIIEDDGVGFDPEEARRRGRLGLLGMSERATMLGGKLTIESSPGKGTTVFVDIPVASGS